jgi:hypothetical protein
MASSLALRTAPRAVFDTITQTRVNRLGWRRADPIPRAGDTSWQASGLTLQSLHGLACSLNPSDRDLTPVQAWFELAATHPAELLLDGGVQAELKRAFRGVVKCPHYGAVIEREAFESIVGRVLGPLLMGGSELPMDVDAGPSAIVTGV